MKAYDEMPPGEVTPFAMLKGPSNFVSKEINTDQDGFRFSSFDGKEKSFCNFDTSEVLNIIIGGSTVFGVGSSSDEFTLSSMLMKNTGETWINLGVRGCVSLQEYMYLLKLIEKTQKIKRIIFLSGINDLYINTMEGEANFFDNRFEFFNSKNDAIAKLNSFKKSNSMLAEDNSYKDENIEIKPNGKYYALLIGNSNYVNWASLTSPKNDVNEIKKILQKII